MRGTISLRRKNLKIPLSFILRVSKLEKIIIFLIQRNLLSDLICVVIYIDIVVHYKNKHYVRNFGNEKQAEFPTFMAINFP